MEGIREGMNMLRVIVMLIPILLRSLGIKRSIMLCAAVAGYIGAWIMVPFVMVTIYACSTIGLLYILYVPEAWSVYP